MNLKTKYNLGQEVFFVKETITSRPCPCCAGKEKIIGADKKEYMCPECYGSGEDDGVSVFSVEKGKVVLVEASITSRQVNGFPPKGFTQWSRYLLELPHPHVEGQVYTHWIDENKAYETRKQAKKALEKHPEVMSALERQEFWRRGGEMG